MKKTAAFVALTVLFNLLCAGVGVGQQVASISQLKEQIARLESIGQGEALSSEVNNLNRDFLEQKRTHLAALLKGRVAALRNYRQAAGSALSPAEIRVIENSIRDLEKDLGALPGSVAAKHDELPATSLRDRLPAASEEARPGARNAWLPVSCEACELPDKAFVVDVSTGETYWLANGVRDNNKTRFGKGERIPVVVVNKNPFLYKYTVTVQETVIVEDALAPFLKTLSPIFANAVAAAAEGGVPRLSPALAAANIRASTECPENKRDKAQLAYDAIRAEVESLERLRNRVNDLSDPVNESSAVAEYNRVAGKYNDALPHFARTKGASGFNSLCEELCQTAQGLQPVLDRNDIDARLNDLQKNTEALKAKAEQIVGLINTFISTFPECEPTNAANGLGALRLIQLDIQQKVLVGEVPRALDLVTQIRDRKKNEFDKMKATLDTLGSRPDMLQETRYVGPFENPTNVAVRVDYKGVSAPDNEASKEAAKTNLNFGGDKRFNLSGGVAYAFLERPEIKPILGFERTRQGELVPNQTTPSTVIGLVDDSETRLAPILMLNTRLTNYRENNLFFSVGITGTADSTGTNIEYMFGPSLNVLDRRVFLTYGLFGGKVQRLNEDLYFGLKVPDATTADKLVQKDFIWKSGFSITYKIK